jgi:hypothetical protein
MGLAGKTGGTTSAYGRYPHLPMHVNSLGAAENIRRPNFKVFQQARHITWAPSVAGKKRLYDSFGILPHPLTQTTATQNRP